MHIYEVMRDKGLHFDSNIVVAKNEDNAKKLVVNMLNDHQSAIFYTPDVLCVSGPIDPNDYAEETVIN